MRPAIRAHKPPAPYPEKILPDVPVEKIPASIGIIMDGNGRWARRSGWERVKGHTAGIDSVRETTRECAKLGVKELTLYAFSVENWKRPRTEVTYLMRLLRKFAVDERPEIATNAIRFTTIGRVEDMPKATLDELQETTRLSSRNEGMVLRLALSYGGRTELVEAVRAIAGKVKSGALEAAEVNERVLAEHLYTRHFPDPDLLIRTSGEMRVSNFLLWQISYAEFVVTPTLWPDFRKAQLFEALEEYARRHRRFGGL